MEHGLTEPWKLGQVVKIVQKYKWPYLKTTKVQALAMYLKIQDYLYAYDWICYYVEQISHSNLLVHFVCLYGCM